MTRVMSPGRWWRAVREALPRGGRLPDDLWEARHRTVLIVLWLHVAGVPVFGLVRGYSPAHVLVDTAPIALLTASASLRTASGRGARSVMATAGLVTSSAVLVHLAGGATEMHFHFFVMLALISLYQDWVPLLVALLFVVLHHAVLGALASHQVYSSANAESRPLVWAVIHGVFVLAASGAQVVAWSMTEQQHERSEAALRESERRFRALIEHSTEAVTVIARDGTVLYDSPSVERLFGLPPADRVGRKNPSSVHPDDAEWVSSTIFDIDGGAAATFVCRVTDLDGGLRWLDCRVTNMTDVPGVEGYVINYRDVTERFLDELTGLPNRVRFAHRVEQTPEPAVLVVGIDDFKSVNDVVGHARGDEILISVAERLVAVVGHNGLVARLGGDEFGVVLTASGVPEGAFEMAARIVDAIAEPRGGIAVTCSVGVAAGGSNTVGDAELAMHRAKQAGKGRVELFEESMRQAVLERVALKADLRRATIAGELVPYYQPIVSLATGSVVGAEALVRWRHPTRGVLPPVAFLDVAEETGLIVTIGSAVLRKACEDARSWPSDVNVSVNLSASQLRDGALVDDVAEILRSTGLTPSRLTLEITETVLVDDPDAASLILGELKALGVSVSLDDFGTGYSSLGYLQRFPVDGLKIDKTFVDALGESHDEQVLLEAIVGIGHTLQLTVVAEGIESAEQWAALQAMGCGLGQGYLFARPMPHDDFVSYAWTALAVV